MSFHPSEHQAPSMQRRPTPNSSMPLLLEAAQASSASIPSSPFDALPLNLIALVLSFLSTTEKLQVAPLVCRAWRNACRSEPLVWRTIDLSHWDRAGFAYLPNVAQELALRAGPCLRKLVLQFIDYDTLTEVVINRCRGDQVEWLSVGGCDMDDEWAQTYAPTLRSLTHLDLSECHAITRVGVAAFCRGCPSLADLTVDSTIYEPPLTNSEEIIAALNARPPSVAQVQATELKYVITILKEAASLESLRFFGQWITVALSGLSDAAARGPLVRDLRKKQRYLRETLRRRPFKRGASHRWGRSNMPRLPSMYSPRVPGMLISSSIL